MMLEHEQTLMDLVEAVAMRIHDVELYPVLAMIQAEVALAHEFVIWPDSHLCAHCLKEESHHVHNLWCDRARAIHHAPKVYKYEQFILPKCWEEESE